MAHLLDELTSNLLYWLAQHGESRFRAAQIQSWLFKQRVDTFDEMTNLPKPLREKLDREFDIWASRISKSHEAADGTEKLVLELADERRIECVLLRDRRRRTICISTQVGCAMGCVFCASGLDGVERNLTTGEIIEQMLRLQRRLPADERVSHVVVMGMGEPLANVDRLLPALELASDPRGLGISPRRITISTVGLPHAMDKLTALSSRFHLAVSLHAADDALRNRLVPVNKNIGVQAILEAADRYFATSGRRLTFEYVLLAGENDGRADAQRLAARLRGRSALLNLIPYNPVPGLPYKTPSEASVREFREILSSGDVNVKVRQRRGDTINAACGQLRHETSARVRMTERNSEK